MFLFLHLVALDEGGADVEISSANLQGAPPPSVDHACVSSSSFPREKKISLFL